MTVGISHLLNYNKNFSDLESPEPDDENLDKQDKRRLNLLRKYIKSMNRPILRIPGKDSMHEEGMHKVKDVGYRIDYVKTQKSGMKPKGFMRIHTRNNGKQYGILLRFGDKNSQNTQNSGSIPEDRYVSDSWLDSGYRYPEDIGYDANIIHRMSKLPVVTGMKYGVLHPQSICELPGYVVHSLQHALDTGMMNPVLAHALNNGQILGNLLDRINTVRVDIGLLPVPASGIREGLNEVLSFAPARRRHVSSRGFVKTGRSVRGRRAAAIRRRVMSRKR